MEIEQVLFQILKRSSLRHVIGILIQISEPHLSILPIREPKGCHVSNGSDTNLTGQLRLLVVRNQFVQSRNIELQIKASDLGEATLDITRE
jgi:hypothetical protein